LAFDRSRFVYDLDALDAAFAAGARSLILCNPHNPTGRVMQRAELEAICAIVDKHGGRVFNDEIHSPLVYAGHTHIPYASINETAAAHTITAMSASKAWNLPGLKCAQMVLSNAGDANVWARVRALPEHSAANLGLVGNAAAFNDGESWLAEVVAYLDGNRHFFAAQLAEAIPRARTWVSEGTYLAWVDFRECGIDGSAGDFFADKAGVILTDGPRCGAVGGGHARFNFATTRPIIAEAVDRMATALGS
jgi:cystathionine beta-lyase